MYEYKCTINRVIDGDTVDIDVDLGFNVIIADERVRIMGIDTPESRTSDKVEDIFGEAAKARVKELLSGDVLLKTEVSKSGEDMKGKFGRILGDFIIKNCKGEDKRLTEILIEEGHAVPYFGGSKDETQAAHEANRQRLLNEGIVDRAEYEKQVAKQKG
jgi:micrococcal nuclease